MKNLLFLAVAAAVLSIVLADPVSACSCIPPAAPAKALEQADAVFSGKVLKIKREKSVYKKDTGVQPGPVGGLFASVEAVFEVDKTWKGTDKKTVSVFTASNSAACGFDFQTGRSYLVYASRDDRQRLITTLCTRTKSLSAAGEDLKEIGPGKAVSGQSAGKNPLAERQGYLPVEGRARIFYQIVGGSGDGGGQVVVIPLHLYLFDSFKRLAGENRTLIFYDPRNRGRSDRVKNTQSLTVQADVEDLERLRKHLGLEKFALVGSSYFGTVAALYALKYPQYVEKIIQVGPAPLKIGKKYPVELTAQDETPVPDPAAAAEIERLRQKGFDKTNPRQFCEKDWQVTRTILIGKPELAERIKSPCEHPNEWPENIERHFGNLFPTLVQLDVPAAEIARIEVPVLVVHGTRDRQAPYGAGVEWAEMFPKGRLLTVRGAAHVPHIDEPFFVFSAIEDFLSDRPIREITPREVSFRAADGIELFADIYESPKGRTAPLIMLFHQGGGDARGEYESLLPPLLERGYNVIAVDLRRGGNRFGSENRTVARIGDKKYSYCDAYQDLEAALKYSEKEGFAGKKIAWGSSFSAALVFQLAAKHKEKLAGILAFSPASGGPLADCRPELYLDDTETPALVLRPASEMRIDTIKAQLAMFKEKGVQTYVAENGVHGSSMLNSRRVKGDTRAHWRQVLEFINAVLAE